ncbi:KRBBA protein, partial [Malurus elegans]|nr:KRBBA protein [Malurus elegans]
REDCGNRGAELLLPRDRDELELVIETLQKPGRSFWIGLWVPGTGTDWTWLNGSRLDRHRFLMDPGETSGKCGAITGNRITSESCSAELRWICQREATEF